MTWVQTRALAKVETDEVLPIKQMCSPSTQISFPHVDLDYKAWNLTELRSCWDNQWLIIQYEPGVPFNGQNRYQFHEKIHHKPYSRWQNEQ